MARGSNTWYVWVSNNACSNFNPVTQNSVSDGIMLMSRCQKGFPNSLIWFCCSMYNERVTYHVDTHLAGRPTFPQSF